ncbi:phosphoglyceromutase [Flavipsychrobacter stenotrophus]|uniref:Phosphoglyceromutase n=1 Tax=Flavipsychrobacter stenotrophus TaxID=2077091 RepID=A0A2S7SSK8_9BACT|nr:alkaline phosphatase family protein [Flavipsychrobacter stenotrophus]PQJ09893.1 phosphoglyceromutase [Flavipsychrobacter stenotrophus]
MKKLFLYFVLFCGMLGTVKAQTNTIENVIIVTTDGFRWQEVYKGMDSAIASDARFNQQDSTGIFKKYWVPTPQERRKKLMPFLWTTLAEEGQLYGNRDLQSNVNNANPYWFSYPGYSEIFTGFVDTAINTNAYPPNPNTNLLEFLNKQKAFKGRVAAFGAWNAFDRILNEKRAGFPVICGKDSCGGSHTDVEQQLINKMKHDEYSPFGDEEQLDVFTHYAALDYLKKQTPKALYISYGETDEWAHHGHYKDYLDAANRVDKWISEIWNYIQTNPHYKDKTLLLVTVDHGRGLNEQWTSHNNKIPNSNEIWFAVMGPNMTPAGEMSNTPQLYQKQLAQTIAQILGFTFTAEHPVAVGFKELLVR